MIVVDGGAYFEALLGSRGGVVVADRLEEDDGVAPELFDAEVLHRITRAAKKGAIDPQLAERMVVNLERSAIERFRHRPLLRSAFRLTAALSGYDALYVALADMLQCELMTTDGRLAATAAEQFGVTVTRVPTSGR